ncbi:DUF4249 family protein [Tunicatimonas pelagia]|uniref:DUF4249 family protein n=1 Tax=Tunicatimonas pelagia TaxID=931531 RepID=UPI002665F11C|nr:DUF4249 family protein [Tunicatimonas pelagia]WKN44088.1 DUF4249 family protein [Tunicatimonas pelagia]
MLKLRLLIFFWLTVLGGFNACTDTVEIEFPEHQPHPVINAFFTPDSVWKVDITTSKSLRWEESYDTIRNATIEIFEGEQRVDSLLYQGGSTYRSGRGHRPEEGKEYTLRFSAPGYANCTATDRVPTLPKMDLLRIDTVAANSLFYISGEKIVVTIRIDDRLEPNYYYTYIFDKDDGDLSFQNSYHSPPINYIEFGSRSVFSDQAFNGIEYSLSFDYENFRDETTFINIGIVSEDYFRFAQDYEKHLYDQLEFLATPEDVYSNIEGGFGIFAGYYSLTFVVSQ